MRVRMTILFLLTIVCHAVIAQTRFFTKSAKVSFYSTTPLAAIEAHNVKAVSVFDHTSGQIEFSVLMKGFEFEKARMQADFNENFVESDKYPKAIFRGNIKNVHDLALNKDGVYRAQVTGVLTIHGVSKTQNAESLFTIKSGVISAASELIITVADYNIKTPALVADKIGKTVKILVNISAYQPLSQNN